MVAGNQAKRSGIYSAQREKDILQLFVHDEMMTNVCWPNALWSDRIVFPNKYWAKSSETPMAGRMVDSGAKNLNLAGSGLEATGAMAAFNVSSSTPLTPRSNAMHPAGYFFTYLIDKIGDTNLKASHKQYFLADKLEFLDQADEWLYDKNATTVSVKTLYGKMSLKKDTRQGLNLNQAT